MKNLPFARIALPEQIAEMIRSDLESKRWSEFLPGERTLSELLQVSRTSLRSALDILEKQGLVRTAHGRRRQIVTPHGTRQPQGKRLASIAMVCPVPVERMEPFVLLEIEHIRNSWGGGIASCTSSSGHPATPAGRIAPSICWSTKRSQTCGSFGDPLPRCRGGSLVAN